MEFGSNATGNSFATAGLLRVFQSSLASTADPNSGTRTERGREWVDGGS